MMILRTAGVSIPPQLMRGPYEPGYRDREPILVSVSAAGPGVKACDSRLVSGCSSPAKLYFGLLEHCVRTGPGIHYRAARKSQGKSRPNLDVHIDIVCDIHWPRPTANVSPSSTRIG